MNYIPKNESDEVSPSPSIRKRSIKDVVSVCPVCFNPTNYIAAVFGMAQHSCKNEECGWSGTIAVEVSLDDYREFIKQRLQEESENEISE